MTITRRFWLVTAAAFAVYGLAMWAAIVVDTWLATLALLGGYVAGRLAGEMDRLTRLLELRRKWLAMVAEMRRTGSTTVTEFDDHRRG